MAVTGLPATLLVAGLLTGGCTIGRSQGVGGEQTLTATAGMVAANHPLAARAGYQVLQQGGNAVDAAVATAAALGVVEPYLSGIGGDGFAAIYIASTHQVHLLNFSGRAPGALTVAHFPDGIPAQGALVSLIPGALMGWEEMRSRYGSRPLAELLEPAIELAREGYPLTPFAAEQHRSATRFFHQWDQAAARAWWGEQMVSPGEGAYVRNPRLAEVYRRIGEEGIGLLYGGSLGQMIVAFNNAHGGVMHPNDFRDFTVEWQQPVQSRYRGYDLMLAPPNSSGGIATAQILNILEHYDLAAMGVNSVDYIHTMVEAIKRAAADRAEWSADPDFLQEPIPIERLTSKEYAAQRQRLIDPHRAAEGVPAGIERGGTTHFSVIDRWGNMVSVVATLGGSWGSGMVAGETGMVLNNGIRWFETDPASPAVVAPGKRTRWNMTPVIILRDGQPFMVVGTPGGTGIWQTLPQVITKIIDFGMDIQDAIESPRFRWALDPPLLVRIEERVPAEVIEALSGRGHQVRLYPAFTSEVGGVNGIRVVRDTGQLRGAADPRRDGAVVPQSPVGRHRRP